VLVKDATNKINSYFVEYQSRGCHLFLSFSAQGFRDILYAGLAYSSIHGLGALIQFHEPGL